MTTNHPTCPECGISNVRLTVPGETQSQYICSECSHLFQVDNETPVEIETQARLLWPRGLAARLAKVNVVREAHELAPHATVEDMIADRIKSTIIAPSVSREKEDWIDTHRDELERAIAKATDEQRAAALRIIREAILTE